MDLCTRRIAERKAMIDREHDLPITKRAELLRISRSILPATSDVGERPRGHAAWLIIYNCTISAALRPMAGPSAIIPPVEVPAIGSNRCPSALFGCGAI